MAMTNEEFRKAIIEALYAGPPSDTYDVLVGYKDSGGEQARAYEILMEILMELRESGVDEAIDDDLTDTMDSVVGDTALRVWPERLKT